jgi:anti-sigma factor RsiW
MTWTCDTIQERIPDLVTGDVSDADRAAMEAHIAGCAACQAEQAEWESLTGTVHTALEEKIASIDFDAIQERVQAEIPDRPESGNVHEFRRWSGVVGMAAAVLLAVFLGVQLRGPGPAPYHAPTDAERVDQLLMDLDELEAEDARVESLLDLADELEREDQRVDSMLDLLDELE